MSLNSKFIIEDGKLILSKCVYHKDLVIDKTKLQGGGWFKFEDDGFTFYGSSHDFGQASLEDIQKAINDDKVFTNPYNHDRSIATKYKFVYNTESELIPLN